MKNPIWKRVALRLGVIDYPGEPTWFPVWLHAAGAVPIVLAQILVGVSPILAIVINAAWWLGREIYQARRIGGWSVRKVAEVVVPSTAGALTGIFMGMMGY